MGRLFFAVEGGKLVGWEFLREIGRSGGAVGRDWVVRRRMRCGEDRRVRRKGGGRRRRSMMFEYMCVQV